MASIEDLIRLVPPPRAVLDPCNESTWAAAESALGVSLPRSLFDLAAAYGDGEFRCGNRYLRISNPGSKWYRRTMRTMQRMYADNRAASGPKHYPHDFFPANPGLLFVGTGDTPLALFFGVRLRALDGRIVALNFQDTWEEFSTDLITLLVSVFRGEVDLWQLPASGKNVTWSFEPDPPPDPAALPALLEAVLLGDLELVRSLVQAGADVNQRGGWDGNTPLCSAEEDSMVCLLLELGADPNQANQSEWTPLNLACSSTLGIAALRALLVAGADPNRADSSGFTPLMRMCQNKDLAEVELLLQFGADPNAVDKRGKTPMQIARKRPAIQTVLRAAGAR
jgi:Ankyrin repeats (many copies)